MKMVKKYLNLIILGTSLLFALLVLATMAGKVFADVKTGIGGLVLQSGNIYDVLGADEPIAACVSGIVFLCLGIAAIAGTAVLDVVLKNKYAKFVACGAAALLLAAAISYFCPASGDYKDLSLGVGSVFSGLFCIISAGAIGAYGALKLLNK